MATASLNDFFRRLTRGMASETLRRHGDCQLIERALAGHDESALQAIVHRHGPMVYRVCWRVLQHTQDSEDAFQATFLVLAQKLRTVRKHASLASWLHGVAYRVALKAKVRAGTQRRHEQQAAALNTLPADDVTWGDFRSALDRELSQLPDKWRLPLILCYLEGRTQDEAASQLGWSKSTLRRRLEEARISLGHRLDHCGIVWPAGLSAVLLADCLTSAAPAAPLVASAVDAIAGIAAGKTMVMATSARTASLAEGVVKAMFLTNVRLVVTTVLALGVLALGGVLAAHNSAALRSGVDENTVGGAAVVADARAQGRTIQKLKLDADDLADITGVNVYKFQINMPKGQRFRVVLRELKTADAQPRGLHQFSFQKESDAPITLRVGFLRADRKLASFLLSEETQAEYRVDCSGCSPGGFATIVPQLLAQVPPVQKLLLIGQYDKHVKQIGPKGVPLISIVVNEQGSSATSFPRAELVVEPED